MCFSPTASFTAGTLLLGAGLLTVKSARGPRELPLAAMSLLYAAMTHAYSFFSHVLWPVYVPVAVPLIEPAGIRRTTLWGISAAGTAVATYLMYMLVAFPVVSQATSQHIEYVSPHFFAAAVMSVYLLLAAISPLISTHRRVKVVCVIVAERTVEAQRARRFAWLGSMSLLGFLAGPAAVAAAIGFASSAGLRELAHASIAEIVVLLAAAFGGITMVGLLRVLQTRPVIARLPERPNADRSYRSGLTLWGLSAGVMFVAAAYELGILLEGLRSPQGVFQEGSPDVCRMQRCHARGKRVAVLHSDPEPKVDPPSLGHRFASCHGRPGLALDSTNARLNDVPRGRPDCRRRFTCRAGRGDGGLGRSGEPWPDPRISRWRLALRCFPAAQVWLAPPSPHPLVPAAPRRTRLAQEHDDLLPQSAL